MKFSLVFLLAALLAAPAFAAPSKLNAKNQFGEPVILTNVGSVLPLPGTTNIVLMTGATAPIDGTTGLNIAAKGSTYVAVDTGARYNNTGSITVPAWSNTGVAALTATLSGLSIAAGTVSSADTILQGFNKLSALNNGTFTPISETVAAAGAISVTQMLSVVNNASGSDYAITLAAPSSQDGQLKVIKFGTATHAATLAMTNIAMSGAYTPTGTTTLTFSISGQSAVFIAVGAKWVYLGGSAIAS